MNSNQLLQQATFLTSAAKLKQCPPDEGIEIAFAGRSNAGKSSAINALTGQTKLARTSKTPGCTQLINFFVLEKTTQRLVDLPGYGYAKVSRNTQNQWQQHISNYLEKRESLKGLIIVMDSRHPLKDIDQYLIEWATDSSLPLFLLLTKADKLNQSSKAKILKKVTGYLKENNSQAHIQFFSSLSKAGLQDAQNFIMQWLIAAEASPPNSSNGTHIEND